MSKQRATLSGTGVVLASSSAPIIFSALPPSIAISLSATASTRLKAGSATPKAPASGWTSQGGSGSKSINLMPLPLPAAAGLVAIAAEGPFARGVALQPLPLPPPTLLLGLFWAGRSQFSAWSPGCGEGWRSSSRFDLRGPLRNSGILNPCNSHPNHSPNTPSVLL